MRKFILFWLAVFISLSISSYEHDLYQTSTAVPNIMFLVDTSSSMDFGVYDWETDYAAFARTICRTNDYCLQSSQNLGYLYAVDTFMKRICDTEAGWNTFSNFYSTLHGIDSSTGVTRNHVLLVYNNGTDPLGRPGMFERYNQPNDPGDPYIVWSTNDFYYCGVANCSSENYTRNWVIDPVNETSNIPVDAQGFVKFNSRDGLDFPNTYRCAYDANNDGVVDANECPRKVTPKELIKELKSPGYFWTGYAHKRGTNNVKDDQPVFLVTANWKNIQPLYNLHLVNTTADWNDSNLRYARAGWKYCSYKKDASMSDAAGKLIDKKTGNGNFIGSRWWGTTGDEIIFTVMTDSSPIATNGTGITITKWRYSMNESCGNTDSSCWYEETLNPPLKTYRHPTGIVNCKNLSPFVSDPSCKIPSNYSVDLIFKKEGAKKIQAYFEFFDMETRKDVVMLRTPSQWRMNRRLDAVNQAISAIIIEKPEVPWSVGYFPATINNLTTYDEGAAFKTHLSSNNVASHINGIMEFFAEGATPTGEALVKVWDYFYNNQNKLWSCRDNHVVVVSDGYPTEDMPKDYLLHYNTGNCSYDSLSYMLSTGGCNGSPSYQSDFNGFLNNNNADKYPNNMEGVAEYVFQGHGVPLYNIPHDGDDPSYPPRRGSRIMVDTISFGYDVKRLKNVANYGNGNYYNVNNTEEIKQVIKDVVYSAIARNAVASASPSVSVVEQTDGKRYSGNIVYVPMFKPTLPGHWWGNIKKFCLIEGVDGNSNCLKTNSDTNKDGELDDNTSTIYERFSNPLQVWNKQVISANGVNSRIIPGSRIIYIPKGGVYGQAGLTDIGLTTTWNFMQGYRDPQYDEDGNLLPPNIVGDFYHASPLLVGDAVISGTNAGYLEVFADEGSERKVIVPTTNILAKHLSGIYKSGNNKEDIYGVDLTPERIFDYHRDASGNIVTDKDLIFVGFRRGDRGFVIYETDKLLNKNGQVFDNHAYAHYNTNFGHLFSRTKLINWKGAKKCILLASGYDEKFDKDSQLPAISDYYGAQCLEINSPYIPYLTRDNLINDTKYPVVAAPTAYKYDLSNLKLQDDFSYRSFEIINANSIYFVDLLGNLYAYLNNETVKKVFTLPQPAPLVPDTDVRMNRALKVFGAPLVNIITNTAGDRREVWALIGTGDMTRPVYRQEGNKIIAIRHYTYNPTSPDQSEAETAPTITNFDDFFNANSLDGTTGADYLDSPIDSMPEAKTKGWYFTLPQDHMVIGNMLLFRGKIYFTTYKRYDAGVYTGGNPCLRPGSGESFLWAINAKNGMPLKEILELNEGKAGREGMDDRMVSMIGTDMASEPILIIDEYGKARLVIGRGSGGEIGIWDIIPSTFNPAKILWWKLL